MRTGRKWTALAGGILWGFLLTSTLSALSLTRPAPPSPMSAELTLGGLQLHWEANPTNASIEPFLYYEVQIKDEEDIIYSTLLPPQTYHYVYTDYKGTSAYWIAITATYSYQKSLPLSYFLRKIQPPQGTLAYQTLLEQDLQLDLPLKPLDRDLALRTLPNPLNDQMSTQQEHTPSAMATVSADIAAIRNFSQLLFNPQEEVYSPMWSLNSIMHFLQHRKENHPNSTPISMMSSQEFETFYCDSMETPTQSQKLQCQHSLQQKSLATPPLPRRFTQQKTPIDSPSQAPLSPLKTVKFKDPQLHKALNQILARPPSASIDRTSFLEVRTLDLSHQNISSLEGLEQMELPPRTLR